MRNVHCWRHSKYIFKKNAFIASRDTNEVTASSRLTADITAALYERSLPLYAKGKLLDLGCGDVPLYGMYKRYVSDVFCVDWVITERNKNHLDLQCSLSDELPLAGGVFDTVILSDVLEHIFKPELLWHEMFRVMSPGGRLILNVPFFYWIHEQPHDYFRYTEFALKKFSEDSGFELIQLRPTGGSPEVLVEIITKHIQHIPIVGVFISSCFQWVTKIFVRTSLGARVSKKTAKILPLGYFMILQKPSL